MSTERSPKLHHATMYASRSTLSAHTAVEIHTTTCTISTLILLEPTHASSVLQQQQVATSAILVIINISQMTLDFAETQYTVSFA